MVGSGRQRGGTVRQRTRTRGTRMIVTLTMNPALDITTSADHVRPTDKIRGLAARYDAGGGGINVARVASVLGASVSAVFPVGGPTGDLLTELVGDADVLYRRVAPSAVATVRVT